MSLPEQSSAHLPELFEIFIGSSRGHSYGACWDRPVVIYESFGPDFEGREQVELAPSRAQWERFWRTMDEIGIWQWAERYEQVSPFEPTELGSAAAQWSVALAHDGRQVCSSGSGAGPGSADLEESAAFDALLEAVSRLLGSRNFV
jgi:hypothetical protein